MLQQQKLVLGGVSAAVAKHEVSSVTVSVGSVVSAHNVHCEIWTNSSNSPGSQVGGDSDSLNVSSSGTKTITFSSPVDVSLYAGSILWFVLVADGGDVNYHRASSTVDLDGGVVGGDFEASSTISNLSGGTTIVPRISATFSDGSSTYTQGQTQGTTNIGVGSSLVIGTQIKIPPASLVEIDEASLTSIGSATDLANAFDGNLSQAFGSSARAAPDFEIGVDHGAGQSVLIRQVWVYAPNNAGPNWKRNLKFYGASNGDADPSTATLLGTLVSNENGGTDYLNSSKEIAEFDQADLVQTSFRYHFLQVDADGGESYVAELRLYR